ncbi:sugar phosphate isomerase/epimerase family protein [Bacillus sp. B1-b2]|uniref:sugar phosphate isomerase/epimerase family protein n=1 Tax=Bacillus sp. B1-b2 TaxID=2653201 RepID=UPI0012623836|nr:sugar phosphate isomerase/epimerase [Bacillus sp. B1-b2]KAB7672118.1 sugar phosphate isomerase/epimerase [Bacillus sp. B1-b2]
MKLGIIAKPLEENFQKAKTMGLDFIELCVNEGDNVEKFYENRRCLRKWKEEYVVEIGSIGRWKSHRINQSGEVIKEELENCFKLIDVASELGCNNFVAGCNYIEELSYYANCCAAIEFYSRLIEYGKPKGVKISSVNCRKENFVHHAKAWEMIHGHLADLGIKYDPSHSYYDGGDYLQETLDWGHRFEHVHLKGSLMVNGVRVDDPPAGLDQTDWASFVSLLRLKGYTGGLSIEPHSTVYKGELERKGTLYTINYMNQILLRD